MSSGEQTIGVISARLNSARLPGKVLHRVQGIPLLSYVVERVSRAELGGLVIATTDSPRDDLIAAWASQNGIDVFRGSESDVAGRYLDCLDTYDASSFARINGDSPWVDPSLLEEGLRIFHDGGLDAVTNIPGRTFPYGISLEILRTEALRQAYPRMSDADREHLTSFLYATPQLWTLETLTSDRMDLRGARLVVDTPLDLDVFERMAKSFGNEVLKVGWKAAALRYLELTSNKELRTL